MPDITIAQDTLDEILTPVGFPILSPDDLEMTVEDIRKLLIWPTMRTYFRFFPIRIEEDYQIGLSEYSIDFPRAETFGVLDARLNTSRTRSSAVTGNPLINAQSISVSQRYRGVYGTPYNYEMYETRHLQEIERQSTIDSQKAFRVHVDNSQRKIYGYTNIHGQLSVAWADYSLDFADVAFDKLDDVIHLAQSKILRQFSLVRGQQNSDTPNSFNYTLFSDEADRLEEEVMERWRAFSKVVMLRG